jgi:hypothetical protein
MFHMLRAFMGEAHGLLIGGIILMAIAGVAITYINTKSFVATIGAVVFGAIVVFSVANFDVLANTIGQDVEENTPDARDHTNPVTTVPPPEN